MFHRLGEAERRFMGLTFHVPAPYRHYFQVRDTLRLAFRPYVPRYAKLRLIGILPLKGHRLPLHPRPRLRAAEVDVARRAGQPARRARHRRRGGAPVAMSTGSELSDRPQVAVLMCVHRGADPAQFDESLAQHAGADTPRTAPVRLLRRPLARRTRAGTGTAPAYRRGVDRIVRGERPAGLPTGLNALIDLALAGPWHRVPGAHGRGRHLVARTHRAPAGLPERTPGGFDRRHLVHRVQRTERAAVPQAAAGGGGPRCRDRCCSAAPWPTRR
jgi:hypothetical protein